MADNLQFQIIVNGVPETANNIKQLETIVKSLTTEWKSQTIGTLAQADAYKRLVTAQTTLATQLRPVINNLQGTQTASANASMALLNLNYVIRDSPYFFNNFALGLLAVGNNLNPLIDSFMRLRMEAGEKAISSFALLKNALVGGAGISIAFSVAVTAIQAFVFQMAKAKKETGETAKEIDLLSEALKRFVKVDMPSGKTMFSINPEDLKAVIAETKKQLDDVDASLSAIAMKKSYGSNSWNDNVEKATKEAEKTRSELEKTKKILEEDLKIYQNELRAREILGKLGLEESSRLKEKTKELEKQKKIIEDTVIIQFKTAQELFDFETNRTRRDPRQESWEKLEERLKGASGGKKGRSIKEDMKEFHVALEMAKVASQELGQYLADAFVRGKFALDAFIASLVQAITQMIILKAITSFLNPAGGGGAASAIGAIPAAFGLGKVASQGVVVVGGKIEMDSNKFVVRLNKAQSRQRTHYGISNGVEFTN